MFGPIDVEQYLIAALIFIQVELYFPLRRDQKVFRKQWRNDLVFLLLNGVIIQVGLLVIFAGLIAVLDAVLPHGVAAVVRSQPLWLQIPEVMLVADLGFYVAHRAFHAFPFLWKFHALHHSIEEMDWLAGYRVHPFDQIITKSASFLPLFALGFSDSAVLVYFLVFKWQSTWIHSNSNTGLGPLKWMLASPQFHHWHHANEPAAWNRNFAGQLPFLDWIGGSLYMPEAMPAAYGTDEPVPLRYDRQMLYPFRAFFSRSGS
jgi:sterol desaturase/sphingolipid hydroxylase (fatty acid hydroxylase superfamily)